MPPPASTAPAPMPAPSGSGDRVPPECTCTPSTTNHCMPQVTDCTDTSQCPSGWLCKEIGASSGGACGAPVLPDGGIGEMMCEPTPPPTVIRQCMPPYADYIGHYYDASSGSGGGTLTGALPPQGQFGGPTGAPLPTGNTNGETGGVPKSGTPGSTPSASSGDTGGCQVGHGSTNAGASLLALFGLMGLSLRRRSRVR
jgi:hypothetical protein